MPDHGAIHWEGRSIHECSAEYRSQLTYVGHKIGIKSGLTVIENIRLSSAIASPNPQFNLKQILQQLHLEKHMQELVQNLSAGQRQRLALARLLISNAKLWILDEPFTAVDKQGIADMLGYFSEHLKQNGIIIMTSHHPIDLADISLRQIKL